MKKQINLKVVGYVPVTTNAKGKTVVLSNKVMSKAEAIQYKISQVAKQSLAVIEHALNIETLREDILAAKANIKKFRSLKSLKGLFSASVNYFRFQCAKIKLFRYIAKLNRNTKVFLNEFLNFSDLFNFSLSNLNIA